MAAILDFRTFMGEILIDFFLGRSLYLVGWKTIEKHFVIFFWGYRVVIYIYLPV